MKYFYDPRSGSCRRVGTVLIELDLQVERIRIDLIAGDQRAASFAALNPNRMVPVLADGDLVLWEAAAIMIHCCETHGNTPLWPAGKARADVLRWMFWAAEHFRQAAPVYFEEHVVTRMTGAAPDAARLGYAASSVSRFAPVLDAHLSGRDFVVGDGPTLADIDLAAPLSQMTRSGVPYDTYPNIMRWYRDLEDALPGWRETGAQLEAEMQALVAAIQ